MRTWQDPTMKLEPGVVTGPRLQALFAHCKRTRCALPAVNVINTHGIHAALAAAREARAPIIIQFSHSGAQFYAGKLLDNAQHQASIAGAIAGAQHVRALAPVYGAMVVLHSDHAAKPLLPWVEGMLAEGERYFAAHGEPLFSSHMLDLSELSLSENLAISRRLLERMSKLGMTLEIELGVTGGEEDGVDHSGIDNAKLYTQPADVLAAYDALSDVGAFTVAASFGNTHGVYKPGNVELTPRILDDSQRAIEQQRGTAPQPVDFVFHGGSGSSRAEIREAIAYGVVKMNIDTDTQWAFCEPIKRYMDERDAFLHGQLGNPGGPDAPNKKHIDPRVWLHLGEQGMQRRLVQAFRDLDCEGKFS
jgi:fructose-bisphosphate aldolase class II